MPAESTPASHASSGSRSWVDSALAELNALQQCRKAFDQTGLLDYGDSDNKPSTGNYERHGFAPQLGAGWLDFYQINHGILIGRCHYALHPGKVLASHMHGLDGHLSLVVALSGHTGWHQPNDSSGILVPAPRSLLCPSATAPRAVRCEARPNQLFQSVGITIPNRLAMQLIEELRPTNGIRPSFVESEQLLWPGINTRSEAFSANPALMASARALMQLSAHTTAGRLQMESIALGMIASVFTQPGTSADSIPGESLAQVPHHHRQAVEQTCGILHSEFATAHTIRSLARRVGINECYLKAAFRNVTGQTIAAYLREIRMARAREAIEDQHMSILQASLFVGYASPGMFSSAFKARYGFVPSALK